MRVKNGRTAAVLAGAALALAASTGRAQPASFEAPSTLPGERLAAPDLLKGAGYEVGQPVRVDRFLGSFELRSDHGTFRVAGVEMLAVRVHEVRAIDALKNVRASAAFTDAVAKSAAASARFVGALAGDPAATVESVAAGAGTVLGRIGYSIRSGVQHAGDAVSRPPPPAAAGDEAPPAFTGDPLGYNQARREWARALGVDPYTSNPVLRPLLDDAALATFAGNFAVNLAVGVLAAPLRYAGELDAAVRESAWSKPPLDLARENERALQRMGVPADAVRAFLRNRWFTPTLQTGLVAALATLDGVAGRDAVIRRASAIEGEVPARFLLRSVALLGEHHRREAKLARIAVRGIVPFATAKDGALVAAAAIDWLAWDEEASAFAGATELAAATRTFLVAGSASPRASEAFARLGWRLRTGLRPVPG